MQLQLFVNSDVPEELHGKISQGRRVVSSGEQCWLCAVGVSRVALALAGSIRGLCSVWALWAVKYLEDSRPNGSPVKMSDGAACLLGQRPPTPPWALGARLPEQDVVSRSSSWYKKG